MNSSSKSDKAVLRLISKEVSTSYILLQNEDMYSLTVITEINNESEEANVASLTSVESAAVAVTHLLAENGVTACTLYDVLEDIIDEFI